MMLILSLFATALSRCRRSSIQDNFSFCKLFYSDIYEQILFFWKHVSSKGFE